MSELSAAARNLNWLVQNFAERVPGVSEAVVVSSDGLPIATSAGLDRDAADRFAAVAVGPHRPGLRRRRSLRRRCGERGHHRDGERLPLRHRHQRRLLPRRASPTAECDVGLVGYEMAVLVETAGAVLTPELRAELQAALPR